MKTVIFDEMEIIRIGLLNVFNHNSEIIVIDSFQNIIDFSDFVKKNNLFITDFFLSKKFDLLFLKRNKKKQ